MVFYFNLVPELRFLAEHILLLRRYLKILTKIFLSYCSKNLLSHVVQRWYRYTIRSREKHYLQLVASLHFIEQERRHRFREWYRIWTEQNKLCLKSKMADHHHNYRLLHQCFHGWHNHLDYATQLGIRALEKHVRASSRERPLA